MKTIITGETNLEALRYMLQAVAKKFVARKVDVHIYIQIDRYKSTHEIYKIIISVM